MVSLDVQQIQKILKHRYPFLMVDKVLELEYGKSCIAQKNVSVNEPYFQGHFPDNPIMPGVMQIEAMAQVGGIALTKNTVEEQKFLPVLAKIVSARFRTIVRPGDILIIEAKVKNFRKTIGNIDCRIIFRDLTGKETLVSDANIWLAAQG